MYVVEMLDITKRFGAVLANDHVTFRLRPGEIHALLGENGAGKTTLMRILYGLYRADEGRIRVNNQDVQIRSPRDALSLGIGMVTQHFALVPTLSVAENIILGYTDGFRLDRDAIRQSVLEAEDRFQIHVDPDILVQHLSVGQKQRVEILKALYRNARVLILDEPTAVLVPQEVDTLFQTLERLREQGFSIVFISHKLDEVMRISDYVTVLRDGRVVGTVPTSETSERELARMMVGRETFGVIREDIGEGQRPLLRMENVWANDDQGLPALKGVHLTVRGGEILGIAGVGGNGQKELSEVLSGMRTPTAGYIFVEEQDLTGASPEDFTRAGVGRIPEDRHEGVVAYLTVAENMALEHLDDFTHNGLLDRKAMQKYAEQLIREFQIKAHPTDKAGKLSGGNMQKVILARVLSLAPKVIIAAQPTRGLDIGATEYVHQQLLAQRGQGAAVLLISEDLEEILALSDRIAVIYEGEIVGELSASEATPERLGLMMAGATKE